MKQCHYITLCAGALSNHIYKPFICTQPG